jgi:hypothetical protein
MGGGGPQWHVAARIAGVLEENPSTNTAPGTIEFRTIKTGAEVNYSNNPQNRVSIHGGTKAGDVTIWSGSLELKGHGGLTNNVTGSSSSTGSFGGVKAGRVRILQESDVDMTYLPNNGTHNYQFYEEGMYTATLTPQGSGTLTVHSDWNKLGYTRIGNKVHVHGNILLSAVSSPVGTNVALNLPYQTRANSSSTNGPIRQTGTLVYYNGSNWYSMPMMIDENDSVVLMLFDTYRTLGGDAPPNVNTITSSWQFRIDFHYFIGRFD